jgi:hypothetical protein
VVRLQTILTINTQEGDYSVVGYFFTTRTACNGSFLTTFKTLFLPLRARLIYSMLNQISLM